MISIIIPTLNRQFKLFELLNRLAHFIADRTDAEIIVVDNGSIDDTENMCLEFNNNHRWLSFKFVVETTPGLLSGRHRGYIESSGELLVFIDDDILIGSEWLNGLRIISNNLLEFDFFTGPCLPLYCRTPPRWIDRFWTVDNNGVKSCGWLSLLDGGITSKQIPLNYVWGLNFIVRKRALERLGGFHPDNIRKDLQCFQGDGESGLTRKAQTHGCQAYYLVDLLIYHQIDSGRMTKEYFGQRAYYQGVCDSYTHKRNNHSKIIDKSSYEKHSDRVPEFYKFFLRSIEFLKFLWVSVRTKEIKENLDSNCEIDNLVFQDVKEYTKECYLEGYHFHQESYLTNKSIRDWVHRDNYFDYQLPNIDA
jgi:glycosyltransferase involved in cell wall biosynthesis